MFTTCTRCGLKHTSRPDGVCPRCKTPYVAAAAAPIEGASSPSPPPPAIEAGPSSPASATSLAPPPPPSTPGRLSDAERAQLYDEMAKNRSGLDDGGGFFSTLRGKGIGGGGIMLVVLLLARIAVRAPQMAQHVEERGNMQSRVEQMRARACATTAVSSMDASCVSACDSTCAVQDISRYTHAMGRHDYGVVCDAPGAPWPFFWDPHSPPGQNGFKDLPTMLQQRWLDDSKCLDRCYDTSLARCTSHS